MNDLIKRLNGIPEIIESPIKLKKTNSPIKIFKGKFQLINSEHNIKINIQGIITFEWFPDYGCFFIGTISLSDFNRHILMPFISYKVIVYKSDIGNAFIHKTTISTSSDKAQIKGVFENKVFVGKKSEPIDEIIFSIPNLRYIDGEVVKKASPKKITTTRSRILLYNQKWKITIDKKIEYKKLKDELEIIGGYNILFNGKISTIDHHKFTYEESEEITNCLDVFLSFVNGRRISTLFLNGFNEGIKKWIDYSPKSVEVFKDVTSCIYNRNTNSLDIMWKEFSFIWESNDGKDFLKTIIHWYIESNNKAGLLDGAIIMAQAGLEKLYYWIFRQEKNHHNNTPQKLRKLITYLYIDEYEALLRFNNLKEFYKNIEKAEHKDIAGAITTIRNDIIHPNETFKIDLQTKAEALQLSVWLIEITLLKVFKHKGKYFDRAKGKVTEFNHQTL